MSTHPATGIITQQRKHKHMHRVYLPFGTGIGRPPVTVKSALIANTDTCLIKAFRMSSYPFNGAGSLDVAIFPDIKVVADPVKSPPAVAHFKVCPPWWRNSGSQSGQSSSSTCPFVRFPFLFLRKKNRISNAISKILSIITFHFYRLFIYRYHALMMLMYLPD